MFEGVLRSALSELFYTENLFISYRYQNVLQAICRHFPADAKSFVEYILTIFIEISYCESSIENYTVALLRLNMILIHDVFFCMHPVSHFCSYII